MLNKKHLIIGAVIVAAIAGVALFPYNGGKVKDLTREAAAEMIETELRVNSLLYVSGETLWADFSDVEVEITGLTKPAEDVNSRCVSYTAKYKSRNPSIMGRIVDQKSRMFFVLDDYSGWRKSLDLKNLCR